MATLRTWPIPIPAGVLALCPEMYPPQSVADGLAARPEPYGRKCRHPHRTRSPDPSHSHDPSAFGGPPREARSPRRWPAERRACGRWRSLACGFVEPGWSRPASPDTPCRRTRRSGDGRSENTRLCSSAVYSGCRTSVFRRRSDSSTKNGWRATTSLAKVDLPEPGRPASIKRRGLPGLKPDSRMSAISRERRRETSALRPGRDGRSSTLADADSG